MKLLQYFSLPLLSSALTLEIYIPGTTALPNPSTLLSSTSATLSSSGTPLTAPLTTKNTFVFSNVAPGSYLLSATSRDHVFEDLRVDVDETGEIVKAWSTFRGNEWDNKGELRGEGTGQSLVRIELRALMGKEYFIPRNSFSITSMFKSPMILLGIFTLLMVVGMPMLMENLDPEIKKELEEMQKGQKSATAQTTNLANRDFAGDLASWMAGSKR